MLLLSTIIKIPKTQNPHHKLISKTAFYSRNGFTAFYLIIVLSDEKCLYFLPLTLGLTELNVYLLCNSSNFSLILSVMALYLAEMSFQFSCSDFRRFLYKSSDVIMDVFCFLLEGIFIPSCWVREDNNGYKSALCTPIWIYWGNNDISWAIDPKPTLHYYNSMCH